MKRFSYSRRSIRDFSFLSASCTPIQRSRYDTLVEELRKSRSEKRRRSNGVARVIGNDQTNIARNSDLFFSLSLFAVEIKLAPIYQRAALSAAAVLASCRAGSRETARDRFDVFTRSHGALAKKLINTLPQISRLARIILADHHY